MGPRPLPLAALVTASACAAAIVLPAGAAAATTVAARQHSDPPVDPGSDWGPDGNSNADVQAGPLNVQV